METHTPHPQKAQQEGQNPRKHTLGTNTHTKAKWRTFSSKGKTHRRKKKNSRKQENMHLAQTHTKTKWRTFSPRGKTHRRKKQNRRTEENTQLAQTHTQRQHGLEEKGLEETQKKKKPVANHTHHSAQGAYKNYTKKLRERGGAHAPHSPSGKEKQGCGAQPPPSLFSLIVSDVALDPKHTHKQKAKTHKQKTHVWSKTHTKAMCRIFSHKHALHLPKSSLSH